MMVSNLREVWMRKFQQFRLSTLLSMGLCIALLSIALVACGTNTGSGQTPTPTVQTQAQKCGSIRTTPRGAPQNPTAAKQAEDCFWQAFQKCQPASLIYTATGVDTLNVRTFTIQNNGGHCAISDASKHSIVPQPLSTTKTYTCSGVTQKSDGLHFTACGDDGDVAIPLQAAPFNTNNVP